MKEKQITDKVLTDEIILLIINKKPNMTKHGELLKLSFSSAKALRKFSYGLKPLSNASAVARRPSLRLHVPRTADFFNSILLSRCQTDCKIWGKYGLTSCEKKKNVKVSAN